MHITSINRNEGKIGDLVIIKGEGLGGIFGGGSITFNGVVAKASSWVDDEIQVHIPAGAVTGPLSVAFAGQKAEVQFIVDVIPHGKERTFQAIETEKQHIQQERLTSPPSTRQNLPSANPEVTQSPLPVTPVQADNRKDDNPEAREKERKLEAETRVVKPPLETTAPTQKAPEPGKVTAPIVISGTKSDTPLTQNTTPEKIAKK